jgi:hypothetical protein
MSYCLASCIPISGIKQRVASCYSAFVRSSVRVLTSALLLDGLILPSNRFYGNDGLVVSRVILMRYSRIVLMRPNIYYKAFQEMKAQTYWRAIVPLSCYACVKEAHLRRTLMTGFITGTMHSPVPFGAGVWAFSFRSPSTHVSQVRLRATGQCFDYLTDTCRMLQPPLSARALR